MQKFLIALTTTVFLLGIYAWSAADRPTEAPEATETAEGDSPDATTTETSEDPDAPPYSGPEVFAPDADDPRPAPRPER